MKICASNFAVARYNSDGTLDTSFNGTGTVTTTIGSGAFHTDETYSVALQTDGKIVAAGKSDSGTPLFAAVRYNSNFKRPNGRMVDLFLIR